MESSFLPEKLSAGFQLVIEFYPRLERYSRDIGYKVGFSASYKYTEKSCDYCCPDD
jgi:hypothetical protein